jgi:hypothetical protein
VDELVEDEAVGKAAGTVEAVTVVEARAQEGLVTAVAAGRVAEQAVARAAVARAAVEVWVVAVMAMVVMAVVVRVAMVMAVEARAVVWAEGLRWVWIW